MLMVVRLVTQGCLAGEVLFGMRRVRYLEGFAHCYGQATNTIAKCRAFLLFHPVLDLHFDRQRISTQSAAGYPPSLLSMSTISSSSATTYYSTENEASHSLCRALQRRHRQRCPRFIM
ncbi:uncharacterized protein LOC122276451 [Carya illinoinensis]|uniref:uncharacterized protein LOC122276451 n=1 Tax=Carya illinoinensis TaxID=32201 RepID=UPI001C71E587|nr:uncharacterized protein LOC122276451 [Carya illinoinensis]